MIAPALYYLMTSEIWGVRGGSPLAPHLPQAQIALIACCILMLVLAENSGAGWCLTADNRLRQKKEDGEGPCGAK